MAKVTAPLMSFTASGAIAKALVFFPWKGINAVRQYVIPTNPDTDPQRIQRGYLRELVAAIHAAQTQMVYPWNKDDTAAYRQLAATEPTPRTWFNQVVRQGVLQLVADKSFAVFMQGLTTPGTDELAVVLAWYRTAAEAITEGYFWYGTSPTALINKELAEVSGDTAYVTINDLVTGKKYYWQFRSTLHDDYDNCRSGIYHGTPL